MERFVFRVAGAAWRDLHLEEAPMVLDDLVVFMSQNNVDYLTFDSTEGKVEIRKARDGDIY